MKVVRQRDASDCGPCCLFWLISYYKGYVSLEKIRLDVDTNKEGTKALNMILASRKYGFDAIGLKLKNIDEVSKFPCIAHLNLKYGYHYVVVVKNTKNKVVLMDPAKGKVIMGLDKFKELWSGIVIVFYPKQKIVLLKNATSINKILSKVLKGERRLVTLILMVMLLLTFYTLCYGFFFQVVLKLINSNASLSFIKLTIIIFLFILLAKIFLFKLESYLENHLTKNIDAVLIADFLSHIYNLPLKVISSRQVGEVMVRIQDLIYIKNLVVFFLIKIVPDLLVVIGVFIILSKISKSLFLVFVLVLFLYVVVSFGKSYKLHERLYKNMEVASNFQNKVIEDLTMMPSIKNLRETGRFLEKTKNVLGAYIYDTFSLKWYLNDLEVVSFSLKEGGLFLFNALAFLNIYNGSITIANLITFNTFMIMVYARVDAFLREVPNICHARAVLLKVNDFLSIPEEMLGKNFHNNHFDLYISSLSFSYEGSGILFQNFTTLIKEGEVVLLKGNSGCGKSTFCNILLQNITDYKGDIYLGGINIRDLSLKQVRDNILYCGQDEKIFSGTIKDNILLDRDVSLDKFYEICKICGVDEIVNNKPVRYYTWISNNSHDVSGGEKQRIMLARALMADFNILILDEALSEVDQNKEKNILKMMREYFLGKTIIYISHKRYGKFFEREIKL